MKRYLRALSLALAGAMLLALTACGGDNNTNDVQDDQPSGEPVLTYAVEAGSAGEAIAQE